MEPLVGSTHDFGAVFALQKEVTLEERAGVLTVEPHVTLAEGMIWVLDSREMQVRAYDSAGQLLLTFGRSGRGPGEFSSPVRLLVSDSQIVVVERTRPFSLWQRNAGESEVEYLGGVRLPDQLYPNDARFLPGNRLLLATVIDPSDPERVPLGLHFGEVRTGLDEITLKSSTVATAIPHELRLAYGTSGWTSVAARGEKLAVAVSLQDTVRLLDGELEEESKLVLPTANFRRVEPPPSTVQESRQARIDWVGSFSVIGELFFISDDTLVVQYQDFVDLVPEYHLLGMNLQGEPLFQIRNTPRLLAWDEGNHRMLAYRDRESLPNELAWYTIDLP